MATTYENMSCAQNAFNLLSDVSEMVDPHFTSLTDYFRESYDSFVTKCMKLDLNDDVDFETYHSSAYHLGNQIFYRLTLKGRLLNQGFDCINQNFIVSLFENNHSRYSIWPGLIDIIYECFEPKYKVETVSAGTKFKIPKAFLPKQRNNKRTYTNRAKKIDKPLVQKPVLPQQQSIVSKMETIKKPVTQIIFSEPVQHKTVKTYAGVMQGITKIEVVINNTLPIQPKLKEEIKQEKTVKVSELKPEVTKVEKIYPTRYFYHTIQKQNIRVEKKKEIEPEFMLPKIQKIPKVKNPPTKVNPWRTIFKIKRPHKIVHYHKIANPGRFYDLQVDGFIPEKEYTREEMLHTIQQLSLKHVSKSYMYEIASGRSWIHNDELRRMMIELKIFSINQDFYNKRAKQNPEEKRKRYSNILFKATKDGMKYLPTGKRFTYDQCVSDIIEHVLVQKQSDELSISTLNWALQEAHDIINQKIMDACLNTLGAKLISVGSMVAVTANILSIIFSLIDVVINGSGYLKIMSIIASLVSLLSQVSVLVGVSNILKSFPNLTDIIMQLLTNHQGDISLDNLKNDTKVSDMLIDKLQPSTVEELPPTELVMNVNSVNVASGNTKPNLLDYIEVQPKQRTIVDVFAAFMECLNISNTEEQFAKFLEQHPMTLETSLPNYSNPLNKLGSVKLEQQDLATIASCFSLKIVLLQEIGTIVYQAHNYEREILLGETDGQYVYYVRKQSTTTKMPSIETMLAMGCGIIGLSLTIASMCGVKSTDSLSKHVILSRKLRDTIKADVKDAQVMVEAIAEDCFGYQLSKFSKLKESLLNVSTRLAGYLENPNTYYAANAKEYYNFRDTLMEATALVTSSNLPNSQLSSSISQACTMLQSDIARAKAMFIELGKAMTSGKNKQEPVPIMLVGRQGAGKTYFARNYLIPQVARYMGWSDSIYSLNFGGQKQYFPPYAGQEICLFDEFLAMGAEDDLIPHINGICSVDSYNMPGAEIWTKNQNCNIKFLLMISNIHWYSLKSKLTPNAQDALYSRLQRVEIVNRTIPDEDNYDRNSVEHSNDFDEFEIRWYSKPATHRSPKPAMSPTGEGVDTGTLIDPYVIITKEKLVEIVVNRIQEKADLHNSRNTNVVKGELAFQKLRPDPSFIVAGPYPGIPKETIDKHNERVALIQHQNKHQLLLMHSESTWNRSNFEHTLSEWFDSVELAKRGELPESEINTLLAFAGLPRNISPKFDLYMDQLLTEIISSKYPEFNSQLYELVLNNFKIATDSIQQGFNISDHLVVNLYGQTGTGKSKLATQIALRLHRVTLLPIMDIKVQNLTSLIVNQPHIVILHDKMNDEEAYSNFYDQLPAPSIIINTNNLEFIKKRHFVTTGGEIDVSGVNSLSKVINRVSSLLLSYATHIEFKNHTIKQQVPGFARRVGFPGYIYHCNATHFRAREVTECYEVHTYGRCVDFETQQVVDPDIILENIVSKYALLNQSKEGITFIEEEFLENTADVVLKFSSVDQAKEYVNNSSKIMRLFYQCMNTSDTEEMRPYLGISERVVKSSFLFGPKLFAIDDFENLEQIKSMAQRSYAVLQKGSANFTCLLDLGDFKAYCAEGKIKWCTSATFMHKIKFLDYEIVKVEDKPAIVLNSYQGNEETKVREAIYSGADVINMLVNGLGNDISFTMPFDHAELLFMHSEEILKHPLLLPSKLRTMPRRILLQEEIEKAPAFYVAWAQFQKSVWYKVIVVLSCIAVSMIGIYVAINLGKMIYSWCKYQHPSKDSIYLDGERITYELNTSRNGIQVIIKSYSDISPDNLHILEDIFDNIVAEKFPGRAVHSISFIKEQSDVKAQNRRDRTGKIKNKRAIRKIDISDPIQQGTVSDTQMSIISKIYDATVWVEGTRSCSYGLRWKGLDVLTPSHLWNAQGELGRINLMVPNPQTLTLEHKRVPLLVYFVDHENDIAVARIADTSGRKGRNTIPLAADLTPYFHEETKAEVYNTGALLSRIISVNDRPYMYHQAKPMIMTGTIRVSSTTANLFNDSIKKSFAFYRTNLSEISTRAGDCGSVYVVMDSTASHKCILGLHSGLMPSKRETTGSLISQEYLAQIEVMVTKGKQSQGVDINNQLDAYLIEQPHEFFCDSNENVELLVDKYAMTDFYVQWYDALENPEICETDDIWYDAETNPSSNVHLIGFDKHFKPSHIGKPSHSETPWSHYLETDCNFPSNKYLSVTSYKNHSKPETLNTIRGIPSLLGTQIAKFNDYCPSGDSFNKLLSNATEMLYVDCKKNYSGNLRILTELEAINGTFLKYNEEIYGALESLDLDTSPGDYPYRRWNITTKRNLFGKVPVISPSGRDIYDWLNTIQAYDVKRACTSLELYAIQGVRIIVPCKDNLKYEIVEKRDKSRLFTVLSIEETMLARKYSGALQAKVMLAHPYAHTQIGINPIPGFHHLYNRFTEVSQYGEAGDFSRWDKHMPAPILRKAFEVCSRLYCDENPEQAKEITNVYKVIADSCINTISIADGHVYMKTRGVPSGCVVTAMINSFCNDIMMYMCLDWLVERHNTFLDTQPSDEQLIQFYTTPQHNFHNYLPQMRKRIVYSMAWINKHVDWATYGDDFCSAISLKIIWLVNFKTRQLFYKTVVGFDYDTPEKDGTEYDFREISKLMFISRIFRREAGLTYAALKKSSVESLLHWSRHNSIKQWEDNIVDCLNEAILWGVEYFEYIQGIIGKLIQWARLRKLHLNVTLTPSRLALQNINSVILDNTRIGILPMEPQKVEKKLFSKVIHESEELENQLSEMTYKLIKKNKYESQLVNSSISYNENETSRSEKTILNQAPKVLKLFEPQATGTQARNPIQDGTSSGPDGRETFEAAGGHIIPKRDLSRVLWREDLKQIAHKPMESLDSPIAIALNTPAHTVVFTRVLNDMTNMPPGMQGWAKAHQFSNATRRIALKFVSAATIINELVVGISAVKKTTYTIQELQLVHWQAINPQDVTAVVDLQLADVSWDNFDIGEANRYRFTTLASTQGTDSKPYNMPTLVVMTRVGIQNSYANSDLSIQIAVQESFLPGGQYLVDQDALNALIPSSSSSFSTGLSGDLLSTYLNLDPGMPFNITCDGRNIIDQTVVEEEKHQVLKHKYASNTYYITNGTTVYRPSASNQDALIFPIYFSESAAYDDVNFGPPISSGVINDLINYKADRLNASLQLPPLFIYVESLNGQLSYDNFPVDSLIELKSGDTTEIIDFISGLDFGSDYTITQLSTNTLSYAGYQYYSNFGAVGNNYISELGPSMVPAIVYSALVEQRDTNEQVFRRFIINVMKTDSREPTGDFYYQRVGMNVTINKNTDTIASVTINAGYTRTSEQQSVAGNIILVNRTSQFTLDGNFSRLSFPFLTPKTIPTAVAATGAPVEFDDQIFSQAFRRKIQQTSQVREDQVVIFNLSSIVTGGIAIVVIYNPQYNCFFIANNPSTDADYYRTYRKLTYEDVIISQVRIVDKASAAYPTTNTSTWPSRVTSTSNSIFNGTTLTNKKALTTDGKMKLVYKAFEPQAEALEMAAAAGGDIISNIVSSVFDWLEKKDLSKQEFQQNLQLLAVQGKQQLEQIFAKAKAQMEVNEQTYKQNIQQSGLMSAMQKSTIGLGNQTDSSKTIQGTTPLGTLAGNLTSYALNKSKTQDANETNEQTSTPASESSLASTNEPQSNRISREVPPTHDLRTADTGLNTFDEDGNANGEYIPMQTFNPGMITSVFHGKQKNSLPELSELSSQRETSLSHPSISSILAANKPLAAKGGIIKREFTTDHPLANNEVNGSFIDWDRPVHEKERKLINAYKAPIQPKSVRI